MASSRHGGDKEPKTGIPLAKDPLPALPKNLLVDNKTVHKRRVPNRRPLANISAESTSKPQPGPSKVVPRDKPKYPVNIDTKHNIMRQRNEDLDCHYNVCNDKRAKDKNASVIIICDDDDEGDLDDKGSQRYFGEKMKNAGTCNLEVKLEPNCGVNITWCLKRRHGRKLYRREMLDEKVKRRLNFNDSIDDTPDFLKRTYMRRLYKDCSTNVFEYILENEVKPLQMPKTSSVSRACVINWLMKVNGADGNPAVIQAACWYFDSVLGIGYGQLGKLHLVAAACYRIAQKLNGPCISAMSLVKQSNSAFTTDQLQVAERDVIIKLKFPDEPIVPQDYISYLSWWCDSRYAGEIEVAATVLAMCGLLVDRVLCDEYPSVIAVAAVRNALLLLKKQELIPRLQMCYVFIAAEKKAANLPHTCLILRRAVRRVATPFYKYKLPLKYYNVPPSCYAKRIVQAAMELAAMDDMKIEGH